MRITIPLSAVSQVVLWKGLSRETPPRRADHRTQHCRGSQPLSPLRRTVDPASQRSRSLITTWRGVEKLKSAKGSGLPTTVLSEPRGLSLFQVVRGGIEFYSGLQQALCANRVSDPHPRPYCSDASPTTSGRMPRAVGRSLERLCRQVQFLCVKLLSFLPHLQCGRCNLPRQCQPSHLLALAVFLESL